MLTLDERHRGEFGEQRIDGIGSTGVFRMIHQTVEGFVGVVENYDKKCDNNGNKGEEARWEEVKNHEYVRNR